MDISHRFLSEILSDDEHGCVCSAMMGARDTGPPVTIDAKIYA
jgi:hypothetical protein